MSMGKKAFRSNFPRLLGKKMDIENRVIELSDVAKSTGISLRTLENTWNGKHHIHQLHAPTVIKLCAYFVCKIGDLVAIEKDG